MNPWMSHQEIQTILKYLDTSKIMLEYGCGGSTLFFPEYVKEYYSIEHNKNWYHKIYPQISNNVSLFYVDKNSDTPESERIFATNWDDLDLSSRSKDYKDYISYPFKINLKFDIVLIDGRARPECAKFILSYLNEEAYVIVHDYWPRQKYHLILEKYEIVDYVKTGQSVAVLKVKK